VWSELEREIAFLAAAADAFPLKVPRYLTVSHTSVPPHMAMPCTRAEWVTQLPAGRAARYKRP